MRATYNVLQVQREHKVTDPAQPSKYPTVYQSVYYMYCVMLSMYCIKFIHLLE